MTLRVQIERWPLVTPFHITGYAWDEAETLLVTLQMGDLIGRGEAFGVYYKNEHPNSMRRQLEAIRAKVEAGISREALQSLLPVGGARNALDCALWDLEAKLSGRPVWQIAGLEVPRALRPAFTCGADSPERMAAKARSYTDAKAIKIKLTGEAADLDRIRAVREARPEVWFSVDANQGLTRQSLESLLPRLVESRVSLIEQPFPIGQEALLDGFQCPIPIAADESVQGIDDIPSLIGRFQIVNIKLDKCGGLTEALAMARSSRDAGLDLMMGNMLGTSLAMAPGFLVGQLCSVVDLDGPIALKTDRATPIRYNQGLMICPESLWGYPMLA